MKKRFLAIAIAAGLASPLAAHADATVYGKIQLQYGMFSEDADGSGPGLDVDNWQVESYASRLGFKGEEDLGNGMSATYKLEYGVDPDGTGSGLSRRNQYLGLKGGFGEVRVGRHDTPLKMSQGKFDLFNDNQGDIATSIGGFRPTGGDNRVDNVVAYLGKASDIKYAVALIPGEGDGTATDAGDGPADSISAAIIYDAGPIYGALAIDSYDDTGPNGLAAAEGFEDRTRLTLMYTMGKMRFGLMWEDSGAPTGGNDADMLAVNFKMGMGKNAAKFQYITAEEDNTGEVTNMSLGYDIGLSKRTTAYVMYNDQEAENNAGVTGYEASSIALGMIHKF